MVAFIVYPFLFCLAAFSSSCVFIKSTAKTGFMIYATTSDALNVIINVIGKKNMNLPITVGMLLYIAHIQVSPQTLNTVNTITINTQNVTVAPTQASLQLSEYNSGYSYKAQNVGPKGLQSQAPILINPLGQVVVP